jgi:uncharacterized cysteine cluster protein YcgN (CxxCxxCC family)
MATFRPLRARTAGSGLDLGAAGNDMDAMAEPFWKTKTLEELSSQEWESLCDGCGKCCLAKLEEEDTGEIHWTSVGCRLFDAGTCRCTNYAHRLAVVPDCVELTPQKVRTLPWLPSSCAYRLVAEGRDLAWWHPLVSGSPETVHQAGQSMRGRVSALESDLEQVEDYFEHVLDREP